MIDESLIAEASRIATEIRNAVEGEQPLRGDFSRERPISTQLRERFIALRQKMFETGRYDPVLGRFDSYTVEQATLGEIADRLDQIAGMEGDPE